MKKRAPYRESFLQPGLATPSVAAVLITASSLMLVQPAIGQDALGSGNVLDANPSRVTGRSNLPAPVQDYRARNLLITGDVAAGRGFRDSVGYTAAGDFRGELATDDIFRFQADSAFSSPAIIQTVGSRFRFAQDIAIAEYRRSGPISVPGVRTDPRSTSIDLTDPRDISNRLRIDELVRSGSMIESLQHDARPRVVGAAMDRDGRQFVIDASQMRGIEMSPADEWQRTQGLTTIDRIRLREDLAAGVGDMYQQVGERRFEQLLDVEQHLAPYRRSGTERQAADPSLTDRRDDRRLVDTQDFRLDPRQPGFDADPRDVDRERQAMRDPRGMQREHDARHREILERIARRYADAEDVDLHADPQLMRELDETFARLRTRLQQRQPGERDERPWEQPGEIDPLLEPEEAEQAEQRAQEEDREVEPRFRAADVAPMLRHGQRVEQLTGEQLTRFNELMAMAEQSLQEGEYFIAERRFIRALRLQPGEPLATAGMAHSQLGAGLYVASSLSLQRLFMSSPEMIDTRYSSNLLPNRPRLTQAITDLQGRLDQRRDRDAIAFLLAYIGHQIEDRELVEQGLTVFEELRAADPLSSLLREVWLGQ